MSLGISSKNIELSSCSYFAVLRVSYLAMGSLMTSCQWGNKASNIFKRVTSLFTNKSSKFYLSTEENSSSLIFLWIWDCSLINVSSNSFSSSGFQIFYLLDLNSFQSLLFAMFFQTSSIQSKNKFSSSFHSQIKLTSFDSTLILFFLSFSTQSLMSFAFKL